MNFLKIHYFIIGILLLLLLTFSGCDNLKCNPDVHPDGKDGGWYFGAKCGGSL